jgi:hypothetical protein
VCPCVHIPPEVKDVASGSKDTSGLHMKNFYLKQCLVNWNTQILKGESTPFLFVFVFYSEDRKKRGEQRGKGILGRYLTF